MKTNRVIDTRVRRQLLAVALFVAILASCAPPGQPEAPSRIGGRVFGVECNPATLEMKHGETQEIKLADVGGEGKVTDFRIGSIRGDGAIVVTQTPAPNNTGWSTLPGAVQVKSTAVDGPTRTVTYYIEILLGGRQGDRIAGGNIWCQVNVKHLAPPTPTFTPTFTPTHTPTPTPPVKESLVKCKVEMKHGETKDIKLESYDARLTNFFIGTVFGDGQIKVSAVPVGIVRVESLAVDGPTRTETYYINIIAGGSQETNVTGANLWCQVKVHHVAPTPTPTPSPKPKGAYIITDDGFRVTYTGPLEVPTGGELLAIFQVLKPDGLPAKGGLTISVWASPSDPYAVHATAELDEQGNVKIPVDINWPPGTILRLLFSHLGKAYEFAFEITVTP